MAALLSPLLVLILLELGLRFAGYGYPTSFLLPVQQGGQAMLRENPRFGWRFFPPTAARTPRPLLFPAKKALGTVRILILGESAAMGDPEASFGLPRQLERILQLRHPAERIEVINAAMTAISSHAIREIARDCRNIEADFWVVYAGNNEVVGPFGAGTVFGKQAPGLRTARLTLAFRATRIGQLLSGLISRNAEPASWEGMEMFVGQQVRRDDPRLQNVYSNFAANLEDLVEFGKSAGAKVLISTVAVNLKDSPPFGSLHGQTATAADLGAWERHFASGRQCESNGVIAEAVSVYQEATRLDPEYAELAYRRATCELQQAQTGAAQADFELARNLDTLRFRTDSRLNQILRDIAASRKLPLVDTEAECAKRGPVGDDLFWDHVHFNFSGNFFLASLFASRLEADWPATRSPATPVAVSEKEIARLLAYTDSGQRRILEEMRLRFQQAPFMSQSNFQKRDQELGRRIDALQAPAQAQIPACQDALTVAPGDWMLHANFGKLLEDAGDRPAAMEQWREVTKLAPQWPDAWLSLGHLAYESGKPEEAEGLFLETLKRDPFSVEAMNELGALALGRGRHADAQQCFEKALSIQPTYNPARINLGLSLAKQGFAEKACVEYRKVLQRDTNNVQARVNLGLVLAGEGKVEDALELYNQALRLQPDFIAAHMNAAKLLVQDGRHAQAIDHYVAVLQRNPKIARAQLELGLELAKLGKDEEALQRLGEAARLESDWVDARFNYGVALAKARRFAQAVQEFQATLKLQPDHPSAKRALERAARSASGK